MTEGCGREIIKHLPYVRVSVSPSGRESRFYINLNISFVSFNFGLVLKKQNGRHITCLMSNRVILLKRPYISPKIVP